MARNTPLTPKRGRNAIPSRVIIGRLSKGIGSEEIIDIDALAVAIAKGQNPLSPTHVSTSFTEFLTVSLSGMFAAGEFHEIPGPPIPINYPQGGLDTSVATSQSAATSTTHFKLVTDIAAYLNFGTTVFATVTFAAGAKVGTFSYVTTLLPHGMPFYIVVLEADATLADVEIVFSGSPQ